MTRHKRGPAVAGEQGFTLVYMAVVLTGLLLFTGLAVDSGRGYMVKAQLSKAVDGAALGAARNLNSGDPSGEAARIFKANFPAGYLGTSSTPDPTADPELLRHAEPMRATGVNVVTVTASAKLPTTFMRLANFNDVTVSSSGEATRRMVDLSLVLDVSSSIGWRWPAVRDAARTFVNAFDASSDRISLITFGNGAHVADAMPSGRGFDKAAWWPTSRMPCPAAARRWSKACIEDGTSCDRCPRARSRACASSCSLPTARPTACPATIRRSRASREA